MDNVKNYYSYSRLCYYHYRRFALRQRKQLIIGSRDSSVGIATCYELDYRKFRVLVPVGEIIFTSSLRPDRFWSTPNLVSNGYRGYFLRG
jgi:hypothetical protein